jgi:hypothetical protein
VLDPARLKAMESEADALVRARAVDWRQSDFSSTDSATRRSPSCERASRASFGTVRRKIGELRGNAVLLQRRDRLFDQ